MTPEETALLLTVASGAVVDFLRPALRAVLPGRKISNRILQPLALGVVVALVCGYHAMQPGPMPWTLIVPQLVGAMLVANTRGIARAANARKGPALSKILTNVGVKAKAAKPLPAAPEEAPDAPEQPVQG